MGDKGCGDQKLGENAKSKKGKARGKAATASFKKSLEAP